MANKTQSKSKRYKKTEWRMVYLTIAGKYLNPKKVAETLNIIPECCGKLGEAMGNMKCKQGYWLIGGGSTRWKVETQMKNILKKISPVRNKLKKLIKQDSTIRQAYLTICLEPPDGVVTAGYCFDAELINQFTSLGIDIALSIYIKSECDKAYAKINRRAKLKLKKNDINLWI